VSEQIIRRLSENDKRGMFNCEDNDLNEHYFEDSIGYTRHLLSVTYQVEINGDVAAYFSLSNASVIRTQSNKKAMNRMARTIPNPKRMGNYPAVKIGRLAVDCKYQCSGLGTSVLDYVKMWFTNGNKTGCRFIVVDAYNNQRAIKFYKRNGFSFLLVDDESESTRLMIFDLKTVRE
jgi:ribosomal protein S18 acetylase RimI-like enzyme